MCFFYTRKLKYMPRLKQKNILCYYCKKTKGIAKLRPEKRWIPATGKKKKEEILERDFRINKKTNRRVEIILKAFNIWRAKGFQTIDQNFYICDGCNDNRCQNEGCNTLLSNTHDCTNHECNKKHGEFYLKYPHFCKFCVDNYPEIVGI